MNPSREAVVLIAYGSHGVVQIENEPAFPVKFRRSVGRPCCGDHVLVTQADQSTWVVEKILARENSFMRADAKGRPQVIAANLDQVIIVLAVAPLPSRDLLDRYLVAVHSLGIEPLIVLNKVELAIDSKHAGAATLDHLDSYQALGYAVVRTSCKGSPGVDDLQQAMGSGTSILVGQSGVGKSSLIRQLLPDLDIQTGALSSATGKGTHTTTTTMLYHLPDGGHLIDSPGVWEYGLWELDNLTIAAGYPEFAQFLGQCRFNDCTHRSEPSCAIKSAVESGEILPWRYAAYCRLVEQNKSQ